MAFCPPAVAQLTESAVLGGPCLPESEADIAAMRQWHALVSRHAAALRQGDTEAAVDLARQIVRGKCSNEHWRLKLAEELVETNRIEESVAVLEAFYARESNAVDRRLRAPDSPLHRLLQSDVYQRSPLAAKLAADRRALDQRRAEARARLDAGPRPPDQYVAKPACPGEYCAFGPWTVREQTALYDKPAGSSVVAQLMPGHRVEAVTGEVRLRPLPVLVRFVPPHTSIQPGSIVFLLDYLGEGHGRIWVQGKVEGSEIVGAFEHCAFPGSECWGEFIDPGDAGRQQDGQWWVQIRTPGGKLGWTHQSTNFER